jgi:hypothetical protein
MKLDETPVNVGSNPTAPTNLQRETSEIGHSAQIPRKILLHLKIEPAK